MLGSQRLRQRVDIHHRSARSIDQLRALLHPRELRRADHASRLRSFRHVQGDHVGGFEQRLERWHGPGIAQRQLGFDVVEQHLHSQRFRQQPDLRADVAIADDAEAFAAHFAAIRPRS